MSHSPSGIARCPHCNRSVRTYDVYYCQHSGGDGLGHPCPLSRRRIPIEGVSDTAYDSRAFLVANLASQVQDEDPAVAWEYLTVLPADELRRLLQIALAAIPLDRTVDQIWAWVNALPAAKEAM